MAGGTLGGAGTLIAPGSYTLHFDDAVGVEGPDFDLRGPGVSLQEDLFFGDAVELGGFVPVTLLILVLMVSRAGVRRLLTPPSASRP